MTDHKKYSRQMKLTNFILHNQSPAEALRAINSLRHLYEPESDIRKNLCITANHLEEQILISWLALFNNRLEELLDHE